MSMYIIRGKVLFECIRMNLLGLRGFGIRGKDEEF